MKSIYKHNWYNRNIETYTYGSPVNVSDVFTSKLYSKKEVYNIVNDYNKLEHILSDIIKIKFNRNIKVKISDTTDSTYTDGKHIVIQSKKDITNAYERLDIIFGLCFHEVAHCLYTNFKYVNELKISSNPLLKYILNIIEDEEIESRLAKRDQSYGKYFAKLKYELIANSHISECSNNIDEICAILFYIVRYPRFIKLFRKETLDKYEDLFIKINNILINEKCPNAVPLIKCNMLSESEYDKLEITKCTVSAAFEIYKYIQDYIGEDFKKLRDKCVKDKNSFINNEGIPFGPGEQLAEEEIKEKIKNEFGIVFAHDDTYEGSDVGDNVKNNTDIVRYGNKNKYNVLFNDMKKYVSLVEKSIVFNGNTYKDVLKTNRFRRNGNLDTNRLADAMQNINTVYNQKITEREEIKKQKPKYAFVIMMDESGSMQTYDHKEEFSVKTAILFYEVLSKYNEIEIYIYGHGDKINPYITKERTNKYVLGNFDKQCQQNDVYSYKYIINDVRKQTNLPIVILNITDFYYHANDKELIEMFNEFNRENISFNMLCLGAKHTLREEHICKHILGGQVVTIKDITNVDYVKDAFMALANIIKTNYIKINRK